MSDTQGWKFLSNAKKAHYFIDGKSLCRKWMTFGSAFEDNNHTSPDNCPACQKKRVAKADAAVADNSLAP